MRLQQRARWFDGYHVKPKKSFSWLLQGCAPGGNRKAGGFTAAGAGWSANVLFQVLKDLNIQVLVLSESTALLCLSVILVVKCAGWK